jgi:phage/plasmid-associated DNA primase
MPPCAAIDKATADYFNGQDVIGQFISDNCEVGKDYYIGKTELYNNFTAWCESEQAIKRPMKSKTFTEALEKREIYETVKRIDGKIKRVFKGIVTMLQKNQEFDLLSHEAKNFQSNRENVNSCNIVTSEEKTTTKTGSKTYQNEEQKRLWEDPGAVVY